MIHIKLNVIRDNSFRLNNMTIRMEDNPIKKVREFNWDGETTISLLQHYFFLKLSTTFFQCSVIFCIRLK